MTADAVNESESRSLGEGRSAADGASSTAGPLRGGTGPHRECYRQDVIVGFVRDHQALYDLINSLIDEDECSFDHHGGCQAHGYLSLDQGEMCPQEEAKRLIEEATA